VVRQRLEMTSAAFDSMPDPVMVCDLHHRMLLCNRAMDAFIGSRAAAAGPVSDQHGDTTLDDRRFVADQLPLDEALRGAMVSDLEILLEVRSGGRRSVGVHGQQLFGGDGRLIGAMLVVHDVTEQRVAETFQALHDPLTGLANRAAFVDSLRASLALARRHHWSTAVLAINLDRFADVAARLGGDSGDILLTEVARRLEAALRPSDRVSRSMDAVARLGGDQFLVLCEHITDARDVLLIVNRIDAALRAPMTIAAEVVSMTACIGFTLTNDRQAHPEALILEAETALHRAKQLGVAHHEPFAPGMRTRLHALIEREVALRQALARSEFRIAYQPKVSVMTGRTTGVEALLRWHHPERGVIAPLDFIPLAEETGLIVPIGAWVLEQVCRDAQRWRASLPGGRPLLVAINVSPRQFESGLAATFGAIMASSGIDPGTVCLEVTEGIVMRDAELAITTLRELKALGFRISIDDFGTGFSSLAYLKRFPLDELKIDKSFVDGLGTDPEDTAIVAAVMGMAHALDLGVVAEGVETADQAARLRTLGCDEAQGYYYGRPAPAEAIDELLITGASAPARSSLESAEGRAITSAVKVLVVDDAADVRQLARSSLAAVGYDIREAGTGEEAIALARQFRPDCVVLDVHLPGLSGLDVCRLLRADPDNQDMTIVMLTVEGAAAEKVEAFSLNADDYMVKPFSPRELVSRVSAAMRRRGE
jgi:diguanylate cyclase (GGDEF)-like protein/PAS domain S-box-containing protein